MEKQDFKKIYKALYSPSSKNVCLNDVPALNYLMIDGSGAPDGENASKAISLLFPIAYKIKFLLKARNKDYSVMPLEGLWWADDMNDFVNGKRENWKWTYMIMQPDIVTVDDFKFAISEIKKKKDLVNLENVRFETLKEGKVAQILHLGPFSEEGQNIEKLHNHIKSIGGHLSLKHHEIYLSDIRKVSPDKLKTILRQPYID